MKCKEKINEDLVTPELATAGNCYVPGPKGEWAVWECEVTSCPPKRS